MSLPNYPTFPPRPSEIGADINSVTSDITSPVHHVITTASLTTLNPPQPLFGLCGPTYLIADSTFTWTTSGNIAAPGTTLVAGAAYGFLYQRSTGKWYPIKQGN